MERGDAVNGSQKRPIDAMMDRLEAVEKALQAKPHARWAEVTSISPLRIRFEDDSTALLGSPSTLMPMASHFVGQRVRCLVQMGSVTIIGSGKGSGWPAGGGGGSVSWGDVTGKPSTFPPSAHTHPVSQIVATGTPSINTFLRGDGTWTAPPSLVGVPWFDVTHFGAIPNGTTDATASVQAAANAAYIEGGGIVYFPPGNYYMDSFARLRSNTIVWGYGATIVKLPQRSNYAAFAVLSQGSTGYGSGGSNITFMGITVRGYIQHPDLQPGQGGGACIAVLHHADRVIAVDCSLIRGGGGGHAFDIAGSRYVTIERCQFIGSRSDIATPREAVQIDLSNEASLSGIDLPGSYDNLPTKHVRVANCQFLKYDDGTIQLPAPQPIGSHTSSGALLYEDISFVDNYCEQIQPRTSGVRGMCAFVSSRAVQIVGNEFVLDGGQNTVVVGVYDAGDGVYNREILVADNRVRGNTGDQSAFHFGRVYTVTVRDNVLHQVGSSSAPAMRFYEGTRAMIHSNTLLAASSGGTGIIVEASMLKGIAHSNFMEGFSTAITSGDPRMQLFNNVNSS